MSELSPTLLEALERDVPAPVGGDDWEDVLRRAGVRRTQRRRLAFAVAAAAAALTALSLATPLGGAIGDTVSDFSAWLRGTPGQPVTREEQRAFEEADARTWAGFPGSPQLRRLIETEVDGVTYRLLGFRSGNSLCIRVVASGEAQGSTIECAPVADLENDDAPVRVLLADWGVGQGDKTKTVGFDTFRAPFAQVTAGIAADGVRYVELTDYRGSHQVKPSSNSFLYVSPRPEVDQLVTSVEATLAGGESVNVPFHPALRGPTPSVGSPGGVPGGPTQVDRVLSGGTIGWLDRREERGEPLSSLTHDLAGFPKPQFGRVLTPDAASGVRVAVMISADRGVCSAVVERVGAGGGCIGREGALFQYAPFTGGYSISTAGTQYAVFGGLASDDVARLEIFTADGDRIPVALHDNAYLAQVALARLPAKLVAYDGAGRVIGIEPTAEQQAPATPTGEPILRLSASAGGSTFELRAVRTKEGGQCWFERGTGDAQINGGSCVGMDWRGAPLRVGPRGNPPLFVSGRARSDIARIDLRYADGDEQQIELGRYGYVLFTVPPEHRRPEHRLVELTGLDNGGKVVERVSLG